MTSSPSRYNENDGDEDQWMYTLYDFQENGIVTKQVIVFIENTVKIA